MKERLDVLLVNNGFFQSRERAKASIMAGDIYIGGRMYDKAGTKVDIDSEITVKGHTCPFVSRGGFKLHKAIETFDIDLNDVIAMDIGASTGGFTDCMLQNGAKKVYAVDVGYGQLDWKLRNDQRVVNMEKMNFRYFDTESIDEQIDFASIDVSFISLKLIFPVLWKLLKNNGQVVALVKPQFEAGREQVGKKGIIRDKKVHKEVIENAVKYALRNKFIPEDLTFSPMTGAKGNIEFLMKIRKIDSENDIIFDTEVFGKDIDLVIEEAHKTLL